MPIEELIAEYERERKNIIRSQKRQDEIIEQIRNANKDDYDWVSVQYAAKKLGVSVLAEKVGRVLRKRGASLLQTSFPSLYIFWIFRLAFERTVSPVDSA